MQHWSSSYLVSPHQDTRLACGKILQYFQHANSSFFPFIFHKAVQLGSAFKQYLIKSQAIQYHLTALIIYQHNSNINIHMHTFSPSSPVVGTISSGNGIKGLKSGQGSCSGISPSSEPTPITNTFSVQFIVITQMILLLVI